MKSLYSFIVKPFEDRYNNTKKVNDKELIINSSIENHIFVSKKAVVVSTPAAYTTKIKVGDEVYIHHNVFRRWYDQKGRERNSSTYFKDDMCFCSPEQIYMYNLKPHLDYCFIKPVLNTHFLENRKEQPNVGVVKYTNNTLKALGITPGTLITFTPNSEFEFIIDGERLYCMKSNDIALTHEYKGNEKENNPSWAKSS
jgi:co-chaperonin GroES (HSP10)